MKRKKSGGILRRNHQSDLFHNETFVLLWVYTHSILRNRCTVREYSPAIDYKSSASVFPKERLNDSTSFKVPITVFPFLWSCIVLLRNTLCGKLVIIIYYYCIFCHQAKKIPGCQIHLGDRPIQVGCDKENNFRATKFELLLTDEAGSTVSLATSPFRANLVGYHY